MDLKTEAQLIQELSEVWMMLDAERTGFSHIIAEKDKVIERLKSLVADLTIGCMDNVELRREDSDG